MFTTTVPNQKYIEQSLNKKTCTQWLIKDFNRDIINNGTIDNVICKIKQYGKHGDILRGPSYHSDSLFILYKIDDKIELIDSLFGFPSTCHKAPLSITKHLSSPIYFYKKYLCSNYKKATNLQLLLEIELDPTIHHSIIKKYNNEQIDKKCMYIVSCNVLHKTNKESVDDIHK